MKKYIRYLFLFIIAVLSWQNLKMNVHAHNAASPDSRDEILGIERPVKTKFDKEEVQSTLNQLLEQYPTIYLWEDYYSDMSRFGLPGQTMVPSGIGLMDITADGVPECFVSFSPTATSGGYYLIYQLQGGRYIEVGPLAMDYSFFRDKNGNTIILSASDIHGLYDIQYLSIKNGQLKLSPYTNMGWRNEAFEEGAISYETMIQLLLEIDKNLTQIEWLDISDFMDPAQVILTDLDGDGTDEMIFFKDISNKDHGSAARFIFYKTVIEAGILTASITDRMDIFENYGEYGAYITQTGDIVFYAYGGQSDWLYLFEYKDGKTEIKARLYSHNGYYIWHDAKRNGLRLTENMLLRWRQFMEIDGIRYWFGKTAVPESAWIFY